ncbi:MAG: GIN domain-containing protein, partial [Anaerolineae bacterium]
MRKVTLYMVLGLVVVLSLSGCTLSTMFGSSTRITGSGNEITETRKVSGFNGVVLSAVGKLVITQGDTEKLTITGDDNIVTLIKTEVRDGKLVIEFERLGLNVNPLTSITYNLTVVNINSLQL